MRPSRLVVNEAVEIASLGQIAAPNRVKTKNLLMFLVDIWRRAAAPFFDVPKENVCHIFFKFYDPVAKTLQYLTRLY